jgi:hypothetical protein
MSEQEFVPGVVMTRPAAPLTLRAHNDAVMKTVLDAVTHELLDDYIRNHALSRGAIVGQA